MSEKPFWEGKTCEEMANLHVKVTFEDGTVVTGITNSFGDIDDVIPLSLVSGNDEFVPYSYVESIELLDDPEYERIENIYRIDTGDVVVCRSGNKYPVVNSTTHELRIKVENYGAVFISREDALFGLRPKPKLPDHDGLWLDKGDGLWLVTGTTVIEIAPKNPPAASISYPASSREAAERLSLFAPFRPAKAVEA